MPYGKNFRDDADFDDAVEAALDNLEIPAGSISTRHIKTKSVRPQNCDLTASWNFTGSVSLPAATYLPINLNPFRVSTVRVFDDHMLGVAPVVLADASKKSLVLTIPRSDLNKDYVYIVKRTDSNSQTTCTLNAVTNDTIDDVTSISIPDRGSLVCVSSGIGWHILANYS